MLEKVAKDLRHFYKLNCTLEELDKVISNITDEEVLMLTVGNGSPKSNKYMMLPYHKILSKLYHDLRDKEKDKEVDTYYTVQEVKAFNQLLVKGTLSNDTGVILTEDYREAYNWMKEQMDKRLSVKSEGYPIWLWKSWLNVDIPTDLDGEYVVLEVKLSKDKVLESNYDAWHVILNDGTFNCLDEDIDKETQHKDWELLFDKDYLLANSFFFDNDDIQAITPCISLKDVKVLKYVIK